MVPTPEVATQRLVAPKAKLSCFAALVLMLAPRPTRVESFVPMSYGDLFRISTCANRVTAAGRRESSSCSRWGITSKHRPGSSTCSSRSKNISSRDNRGSCMFMGASRDDHTGRKDQWEGWEMEEGDAEDDMLPDVKSRDWRLFRKNLISQYGEDNGRDPWGEGCWAHDIGTVEAGSLLLATEEIESGIFHQSVILILSHHEDEGTLGLIINHPGPQRLHSLPAIQTDLAEVFGDSQVFDGGPMGLGTMTVLHDADIGGSDAVLNGVYAGGFEALIEATRQGRVSKDHVRFVHGHSAWSPGQLQDELDHNQWFVAAAAPELITGNCNAPFNPLWGKLLRLMGGRYQEIAKRNEPRL